VISGFLAASENLTKRLKSNTSNMPNLETQNSQDNCVEGGSLVITVTLTTLFCNGEQPSQWKMAKICGVQNP